MACEKCGYYEAPKKEVKHEAIDSKKCGSKFILYVCVNRETNEWWLAIFNGVYNHNTVKKCEGLQNPLNINIISVKRNTKFKTFILKTNRKKK